MRSNRIAIAVLITAAVVALDITVSVIAMRGPFNTFYALYRQQGASATAAWLQALSSAGQASKWVNLFLAPLSCGAGWFVGSLIKAERRARRNS